MFFVPDYQKVQALLSSVGLKEGEDYVDGSSIFEASYWVNMPMKPQVMFERT